MLLTHLLIACMFARVEKIFEEYMQVELNFNVFHKLAQSLFSDFILSSHKLFALLTSFATSPLRLAPVHGVLRTTNLSEASYVCGFPNIFKQISAQFL
jgi:hypothetical protein